MSYKPEQIPGRIPFSPGSARRLRATAKRALAHHRRQVDRAAIERGAFDACVVGRGTCGWVD